MATFICVFTAEAASLTVNSSADAGPGTLRQAIIDATTNAEANVVNFAIPTSDPGYSLATNRFTISLLSPLPNIPLAAITINNDQPNAISVQGNGSFRVFTLVNSSVVTLRNITISNGFADNGLGGGIFMGNSATLTLNACTVTNNAATTSGGGIYMSNSGTVTLIDSTIRNNTSANGAGIFVFDSGTLNVTKSTINANTVGIGGNGGGIYNGTSGTLNIVNSTIDGNSAGSNGGGIYNTATANVTNSTISGNTATRGGGIFNGFIATINNNLIALNMAQDGPDLVGRASLGQAYSGSYNLIGNADGSEGLGPTTNQLGSTAAPIDPRIGTLRNNGGRTMTRALLNRSPALDKGNSPGITTDQTGSPRPYDNPMITNAASGDGSDVGAFERTFSFTPFDFDADGKADLSVYRPSTGQCWYLNSSTGMARLDYFGASTDVIVPADYTADGKCDVAVWRPSTGEWFVLRSEDHSFYSFPFGSNGDVPAPADFDADGKSDAAVFRPSNATWYVNRSSGGTTIQRFGTSNDLSVPADYDGDGAADIAIYRPSTGQWWLNRSTAGLGVFQFGTSSDRLVPGDYNGDGKSEIAFWRPSSGEWFVMRTDGTSFYSYPFGIATDLPVPADYDGDGKVDGGVFRPSNALWFVQRSTAGTSIQNFGHSGDTPIPNAYVR